MLLIFPYIFNQRAVKHSKCLAFVSSEFLTGVDMAEKNTAVSTLEGNSCYFLLKTFLKNSNRYWPESWGKNNGRISITTVYSTGQQRCNSTMHNGVSILFRDYETCGLFSFFAILLSNRTCPTTLQVHLGKEQIIIILAGDTGWPKLFVLFGHLGLSEEVKDVPSPDSPQLGLLNWEKYFWRVLAPFS